MATIEQRLQSLESKAIGNLSALILCIDGEITPEQQQQVDEAESQGRKVLLIRWEMAD